MPQSLSQYDNAVERMTEWLFNNRSENIKDKDTFELFFKEEILDGRKPDSLESKLMKESFERYKTLDRTVSSERIFSKAKGKDLSRDKLKRAKIVVKDRKTFIRRKAQNVDLEGLDTPTVTVGLIKRRTVTVERQTITRRDKPVIVFRAKDGRFASPKV